MAEQLEDTLGAEIAAIIKEEIAPLRKRMDDFEARGIPEYVGIWEEQREYSRGNLVTKGGSLWHCEQATRSRPGTDKTWRLIVKRGTFTNDPH